MKWSYTRGGKGVYGAGISLELDGRQYWAIGPALKKERSNLRFGHTALRMDFCRLQTAGNLILRGTICNDGAIPVRLGTCCLMDVSTSHGGRLNLGRCIENMTFMRLTDRCGGNKVVRIMQGGCGNIQSKIAGHLYNPDTKLCLLCAFLTFDRMTTWIELIFGKSGQISDWRAVCDFAGYELMPGTRIETEQLYVALDTDPHRALTQWADAVASHYQPKLWAKPPVGYGGGAWRYSKRAAAYLLSNLRAIYQKLPGFGVRYVWVSIANLDRGLPGNWLKNNRKEFPRGLPAFIRKAHKLGFKVGLWIAPFWVCPLVKDQVRSNRDNLLMDADGNPVVYKKRWPYGYFAMLPPEKRPDFYCLDGSHPRTHRYLRKIFSRYRRMGIRYYMLDFLDAGFGSPQVNGGYARHHDRRMIHGPQVYRAAMQVIRRAVGKDTYLLSSTGPTYQNIGLTHGVRTGADFGEGRAVTTPGTWFYPATFEIGGKHANHMSALQDMACSFFAHNRWYLNDAGNVLTVDKPLPLAQARIHVSVFGICGGPLMLGDDFEQIDPERLALIKLCLPRASITAIPVDLFSACAPDDCPHVFRLDLDTAWGTYRVLAIFNDSADERSWNLDAGALNLNADRACCVYDFWNQTWGGVHAGQFTFRVPGASVGLYRIEPYHDHPWLLATDMHILQGYLDVPELRWDPRRMVLAGQARRPRGERGNLFIILPPGWKPVDYAGLHVAKHAMDNSVIITKNLYFQRATVDWLIRFERF